MSLAFSGPQFAFGAGRTKFTRAADPVPVVMLDLVEVPPPKPAPMVLKERTTTDRMVEAIAPSVVAAQEVAEDRKAKLVVAAAPVAKSNALFVGLLAIAGSLAAYAAMRR